MRDIIRVCKHSSGHRIKGCLGGHLRAFPVGRSTISKYIKKHLLYAILQARCSSGIRRPQRVGKRKPPAAGSSSARLIPGRAAGMASAYARGRSPRPSRHINTSLGERKCGLCGRLGRGLGKRKKKRVQKEN